MIGTNGGIAYMGGVTSWKDTSADAYAPLGGNAFAGNAGSANFAMAIDLETSNGVEISGLNAEEQVFFIFNPSLIFLCLSIILLHKNLPLVSKYILTMTP
jgi:hypothetical protein